MIWPFWEIIIPMEVMDCEPKVAMPNVINLMVDLTLDMKITFKVKKDFQIM